MNIFEEIEVESLVRYLRERALGEKTLKRQLTGNLNTANWINKIKSKKHHAGDAKDNSGNQDISKINSNNSYSCYLARGHILRATSYQEKGN